MSRWSQPLLCAAVTMMLIGTAFAQQSAEDARWSRNPASTQLYMTGAPASVPASAINYVNPVTTPRVIQGLREISVIEPNFRPHPSTVTWQSEVPITRHPTNQNIMYGSSNAVRFSPTFISEGMYLTTNGGATWFGSDTTMAQPISGHSGDPAPVIDKDGRLIITYLGGTTGMQGSYSTDMGTTWANSVAIPGGSSSDKNFATSDDAPTSAYYGRVYNVWTNFAGTYINRIVISYSTNGGVSWSTAAPVSPPPSSGHHHQGCDVRVGPNGEVYVVWANCTTNGQNSTEDSLGFAKSTDGGITWQLARNNAIDMNGIRAASYFNGIRVSGFPRIDVDRTGGPRNGWIYVTAPEKTVAPARDPGDITCMRSSDGGATWTKVLVNQDAAGPRQYMSAIRVDETGAVNIVYYDQRNTTADSAEVWLSRSIDGGSTWTDIQVSDARFRPAPISGLATGYQGDYIGITSGNGKVWPIWADNRTGIYQAWMAGVITGVNFGWVKGTVSDLTGGAPLNGVQIDFVESIPQIGAFTNVAGFYKGGAIVDTPATTRNVTLRARKFGYVDTTLAMTITRGDTLTRNFSMRRAPGGTLSVFAHAGSTNIRAYVEVKFGSLVVVADSTSGTTGLLTAPLPVGTYSVKVDPPSPYATRNFAGVVITDGGTTNVDASLRAVFELNPTAVRDTLPVGGSRSKTLVVTNTTADTVRFRVTDDNAAARIARIIDPSLPSVKRSMQQQTVRQLAKGEADPTPGEPAQIDGRGGPDAFGYSWIDSDEPGGPPVQFYDIRSTGTQITTWTSGTADDGYFTTPMPWSFPIYGTTFSSINICTNGFVNFGTGSTSLSNGAIPSTGAPNNAIYAFWDDLDVRTRGKIFYYNDVANGRFIVQYDSVPRYNSGGATGEVDTLQFQIVMTPNGEVLLNYRRMYTAAPSDLQSSTIGIENATGTVALQVVNNAAYMHSNLTVRMYLPDAPWLSEAPSVGAIPPGGTQNITCTFDATGLTPGSQYNANIFVEATHPDVARPFTVPASLNVQTAGTALLVLNKSSITFPGTVIGNVRRDTIRARNQGGTVLNVTSISTNNARYTVSPASATLNPNDSVRVIVTYSPVVPAGTDTGRVIFLSNSSTGPRTDVTLTGTAIGAPTFLTRVDSLTKTVAARGLDSTRFYVRNTGTLSGSFAARAVMYPRTAAGDRPGEPMIVPVTVTIGEPAAPQVHTMADLGPAPRSNESPANGEIGSGVASILAENAYGINLLGTPANSMVRFDPATPGTLVNIGTSVQSFAGDYDPSIGAFLAIRQIAPISLGTISTTTGAFTLIGATTPGGTDTWTALKIDPTTGTIYATGVTTTSSNLYTINRTTGAATLIAPINGAPALIAFDFDNSGQMYGYTLSDTLYSINKTTGAATRLGYIGFNCNNAQDMDFDRATGICYLAAYNGTAPARGELRIANLTTGNTTLVGPLGTTTEMDCFSFLGASGPIAGQWLSVAPTSGTIAIGDSVQLTAKFDASDISIFSNPGNYFGRIEVFATNSGLADTLKVPARMTVTPLSGAALYATPDSVVYGNVPIGVSDSSKSFLVKNIGSAALNVTNVVSSNTAFVPSRTAFSLNPNDTTRIRVKFTAPTPAGLRTGTLTFTSNDPGAPTIRVRGTSIGQSNIAVAPDTFSFTRASGVDTTRATFRIRNTGTDTLRYRIDEGSAAANDAAILRSTTQQSSPILRKGEEDPTHNDSPGGRGGPDAFGYTWIDSDEPGGPAFAWSDISTVGTEITAWTGTPDDGYAAVTLPWAFPFYGVQQTSINVVTNGFLNFGTSSTAFSNGAIPSTAAPNNAIYPFWDDMDLTTSGKVYTYNDVAGGRFIIQYHNAPRYGSTAVDTLTFQVILKPSGEIRYQYLRVVGTTLNSATIGVEDAAGAVALQVVYNAAYVHNNLAVLISNDVLPWASTDRVTGTIAPADSQAVQLRIHPVGLANGVYDGRFTVSGNTPSTARVGVRLTIIGGVASIAVTAPNGGEVWNIGSTYNITWNQSSVDTVTIGYSTTGRTGTYTTITSGVPARPEPWKHPKAIVLPIEGGTLDQPDGTFAWTVPNTPSTNCFVRVIRKATGTPGDTSNAAFTIRTSPPDSTWVSQTSGTTTNFYCVKAVDINTAWAGGGTNAGTSGFVRRTTDGGTTWTSAGTFPGDVFTITAVDANTAIAANYTSAYTRLVRTTNGGITWTTVDSIALGFYDYVHMFNATNGYAMGDPVGGNWVLKRTTNGGVTWTSAATLAGTDAGWNNSMMWLDANNGWFGSNSSKIYRTTNGGTSWTSAPTTFVNSYSVGFTALNTGLAGSSTGPMNKSTDGGATWTTGPAALGTANLGLWANPASQEFWATSGNSVFYSSNAGTAWLSTPKNGYTSTAQQNHVNMVKSGSNIYGWAVGSSGTVARYRRLLTGVESTTEMPGVFALDQNYPNPFNPSTTIRFALPEQARVSLKVYNLLGQEVASLANGEMPAAFHNVVWNGRNSTGAQVASGMYFYRIEATGLSGATFNSLKKLILLK